MLLSLTLKDFVLIKHLTVDFSAGMTVLTGETGAGKSILIDALVLVLGDRADVNVIREGADRADIVAEFTVSAKVLSYANQTQWLNLEGEDRLILRRIVERNGRSRAFVNGMPITLNQMKELAECLVDIHGQHAHYLLARPSTQLQLLDAWAGHKPLLDKVSIAYEAWKNAVNQLEQMKAKQEEILMRRSELEWQLGLLKKLDLKPGQWQQIEADHKRVAHASLLVEQVQQMIGQLEESEASLLKQTTHMISSLEHIVKIDQTLNGSLTLLNEVRIQLQECAYELNHWLNHIDLDPARFAELEEKVGMVMEVSRRLRASPDLLISLQNQIEAELNELVDSEKIDRLTQESKVFWKTYEEVAYQLTQSRQVAAQGLSKAVSDMMQTLQMRGGKLEIELSSLDQPSVLGMESIEFLFAGHAGVVVKPLAKIASGGELARVSLAISVVCAKTDGVDTLVFDEVDTGIGGATAEVVGQLLKKLGLQRQVLCVTHLAQVAAMADHHFLISKINLNESLFVESRTKLLTKEERVDEIARMLGGLEVTETTKKHAQEWLEKGAG